MKLLYDGKTKAVYELDQDKCVLEFKDDITGEDGRIDPGSNYVLGKLEGKGKSSLKMSQHFFKLLQEQGVPSHYIDSDLAKNNMVVWKAQTFGQGLEVVCRFKAYGSFLRRYARYAQEFQPLNALVEVTLKDDERGDPLINDESLIQLGLLTERELEIIKALARKVAVIVKNDLALKGLELVDIKFEFGRIGQEIVVIDDISGDNMRVFKNGIQVPPRELSDLVAE
ncbi:phosphoribosylaminoimidazolesuccinocarboxamide synthase [Syntrophomonas wolfei]|uniref:Phosphoribosylaminoimidazole-succinocarboxamide synthase n=1 Tax=Syntrophomonas wolfei subsp. wolfei (strain DSM 2245B / Goettingen) TaxID=335541 RepID=Q0AXN6_SYNWW|nr:phosphoribosylaminoimidazolesuccinocarboxamide synthase [Syntrophomonas wolfei]ABI68518.1 phosphoribosylaminoimidazole-succinocarboxamide synthase [Syntrophomonas wolfei subsp. wolfei str. Goettingen G311]